MPPANSTSRLLGVLGRQQPLDLGVPQRQARARADVAAALAALEHEAACAVAQEPVEQGRRGHVQVGGDADVLEWTRLRRPASGDQGQRRSDVVDHFELRSPHVGRHEPEDADTPRPVTEQLGGLGQQVADLAAGKECERQERQPAGCGHAGGELGSVGDAGHRALGDRVPGAVRLRDAGAWGQRPVRHGGGDLVVDGGLYGLHHTADRDVAAGEPGRGRGVLAEREQVAGEMSDRAAPATASGGVSAGSSADG